MAGKKRGTKTESTDTKEANKKMKLSTVSKATNKLEGKHFNVACNELANFLLGKLLVRKLDEDNILKGRIVETECYPGGDDKGSLTHGNRRTPANEPLYMKAGTAFVYMTYGMYHCFNISGSEEGGGVLLRALEPIQGIDKMQELRLKKRKSSTAKPFKEHELCNGPSKLCVSMDITKTDCNTIDLSENDMLWIENDPEFKNDFQVVKTGRIGIDRAGPEWAKKPYRFYILGNDNVSVKDKTAEELLSNST